MRNPNGTGTVSKKSGRSKPWVVYGAGTLIDGVYKRPYLGSFKTKKEAEQRRMEFYLNPNIKKSDLTFKEIFDDFCQTARYKRLGKSQQAIYNAAFKDCGLLYSLTFANIRTAQLQACIDDLEKRGRSFSKISKQKVFFSVLFSYAIENDIVNKNYAQFIVLPKVEQKAKRAFTDLELKKIMDAAQNDDKAAKWTLYLILSGWRIGELLELTRFNYDSEEHCFTGGKKTAAGKNRRVPVHPSVQTIVNDQLAFNGKTVFCMDNGEPMTSNYFRRTLFNPMITRLNLGNDLTPHNTRHTFATLLKRAGTDDFYRKRLLGHSSGNVTDDIYTHEDIQSLHNAVEKINLTGIIEQTKKSSNNNLAQFG